MNTRQIVSGLLSVVVLSLLWCFSGEALAQDEPPDAVFDAVEKEFTNFQIREVEPEIYKGRSVWEVELTTEDGTEHELYVTPEGEILNLGQGAGLPLIGGQLSLGLAVRVEREIYKDADTEFEPSPFLLYENGPLQIQIFDEVEAVFEVWEPEFFSLSVGACVQFEEGYDTDDNDFLEGMDELHTLYGPKVLLETQWGAWEAGLEYYQEVSSEHHGQTVELSLQYNTMVAGFLLEPQVSLTWMSEDVVDYFYGVSASEARADRPAYSPIASFELSLEVLFQRPLFDNVSLVGVVEISTYGSEIRDSPLVDRSWEIEGAIGVMYTF